ncbi:MAG TPA: hypothetical protein VM597_03440 [Gemmataceae bacterium]|nr:hypothetical protein [Gemmataceae bacterium]
MLKTVLFRLCIPLAAVIGCALAAGCLAGNPSYFPYLLPVGDAAVQTHAKPVGPGYFADFDARACRIEVRPEAITAPARGTQVLIATIYDADGKPRRKRRVEWIVEGPGTIVEVDESGWLPGRGMKVDNKYGFSHTDYFEHTITRGNDDPNDDFCIRPGQTWCAVTSAVEGQTTVIAYAPEIADWDKNKQYVRINWIDANLNFPPPVTARAGGEYTFATKLTRAGDGAAGYRIRYRIVDGPPAALYTSKAANVGSVTEATTDVEADGLARVSIQQPAASPGTNRIIIEVVKPLAAEPGQFQVVSKGETKITWQAPQLNVNVTAARTASLNRDLTVTYGVNSTGGADAPTGTLTAPIPDGLDLVRTEPRAVQDGGTLIWTLNAVGNRAQTFQAVYQPRRLGQFNLTADARTPDGLSARGLQPVQVTEAKLELKLEGPKSAVTGEALPFQATVMNHGEGAAEQIRIRVRLEDGLQAANKTDLVEGTIAHLPPGGSKSIALPITAVQPGRFGLNATAVAEGNLIAPPQTASVDVRDVQLSVSGHGPGRVYVGQEATWKFIVRNTGEVTMDKVALRATLPPEMRVVSASAGGRSSGREVVWDFGTAPARREKEVTLTVTCTRLAERTKIVAAVRGTPVADQDGLARPVSLVKPLDGRSAEVPVEILGIPALQVSVKDADDPVGVGQATTYTIRVRNTGTLAAKQVIASADVPRNLRPVRATGPGKAGQIDGQRVVFPPLDSLAPDAEATFVVAVEGSVPGDARFRAEVRSVMLAQPLRAEEPTRVLDRSSGPARP